MLNLEKLLWEIRVQKFVANLWMILAMWMALVIFLVAVIGCGGGTNILSSPAPKPECKDAVIANSEFATLGQFALKEAWIGMILSRQVPKPALKLVAQKAKAAAAEGSVQGLVTVLSTTLSEMGASDYALLVVPVVDLFQGYNSPTLHPCDKELLVKLFTSLEALTG